MAQVTAITFEGMLSVEGCAVKADFNYLEAPCGLQISKDVPIPGAFWPAMRWAHEQHHMLKHTYPLNIVETVYTHEGTVTITCRCDCPRGE